MSDVIRNVVVKISLQQQQVKLKAPDTSEIKKAIEEISKSTAGGIADAFRASQEEATRSARSTVEKIQAEYAKLKIPAPTFSPESRPGFGPRPGYSPGNGGGGGGGGFRPGGGPRPGGGGGGLTAGGISAGASSLLSGASSLANGYGALAIGSNGAAALQSAGTAIGVAQTIKGGFEIAKMFGPYGLVVGAAVAGVALIDAAWNSAHEAEKKRIKEQEEHLKRVAEITQKSAENIATQYELEHKRAEITRGARSTIQSIQQEFLSPADRLASLQANRIGASVFAGRIDRATANANRVSSANGYNDAQRAQILLPDIQAASGDLAKQLASEKEIWTLKKQIQASEIETLRTKREQVKAAEDLVKTEKRRVESLDEITGRLDAGGRKRIDQLGKKVSGGGTLSASELAELEGLGGAGAGDFVAKEYAKRGRASGGAGLFSPFQTREVTAGERSTAGEIGKEIEAQRRRLGRVQGTNPEAAARLQDTIAGLTARQQDLLNSQGVPLRGPGSELAKLEETLAKQSGGQTSKEITAAINKLEQTLKSTRELPANLKQYVDLTLKLAEQHEALQRSVDVRDANHR